MHLLNIEQLWTKIVERPTPGVRAKFLEGNRDQLSDDVFNNNGAALCLSKEHNNRFCVAIETYLPENIKTDMLS